MVRILLLLVLSGVHAEGDAARYKEYETAKKNLSAAEDRVTRFQKIAGRAGGTYERLKAERNLQSAQKVLRDARRDFENVKKKMKPGDRAFLEETRFKGNDAAKDPRRPAGPVDPLKNLGPVAFTSEPAEIRYTAPPGAKTTLGRMDSGRWKTRMTPSASAPAGKTPPATQKQFTVDPAEIGGGESAPRDYQQPVDYVGSEVAFDFIPFSLKGNSKRGGTRRETAEEFTLIQTAMEKVEKREFSSALQDAVRLESLRPQDPRVRHLKAMIFLQLKRFEDAEKAAREALELGMETPDVYESLGTAQLQRGRYDDAVASASEAIRLDPSRGMGYMIRAMANEKLGRTGDMKRDAAAAAKRSPQKFGLLSRRAQQGLPLFNADPTPVTPTPVNAPKEVRKYPFSGWLIVLGGLTAVIGVCCYFIFS